MNMSQFVNIAQLDGTYKTVDVDLSVTEQNGSIGSVGYVDQSQTITSNPSVISVIDHRLNSTVTSDRINDICIRVSTISKILSKLLRTNAARYFTHNEFDKYANELDNIAKELDSYV